VDVGGTMMNCTFLLLNDVSSVSLLTGNDRSTPLLTLRFLSHANGERMATDTERF